MLRQNQVTISVGVRRDPIFAIEQRTGSEAPEHFPGAALPFYFPPQKGDIFTLIPY
jgi:hypothetical protein